MKRDPEGASARWEIPAWGNTFVLVALSVFFFIETTSRLLRTRVFDEESLGDFLINLSFTWRTLETGTFPADFYYPPPYIALYQGLGALGVPAGSLVWFASMVAGAIATCVLASRLCGWSGLQARWLWVAAAVAVASYYVQWDLRTGNSNLIYLALLLGALASFRRERPGWAGFLLAASVSLKLYSVLLLPYLLLTRRHRWLVWSVAWLAVAFAVVPAVVFGPVAAFDLTSLWLAKLLSIPDPAELPSFYKSLARSLLVFEWDPGATSAVAAIWQGLWALTLGAWFVRTRGLRGEGEPPVLLLGDVAVLALLPLPFSPTFQPHHAVVVLLPVFLLLDVARREGATPARAIALGLLALAFAVVKFAPGWPVRGVAIQLALWVYAIAMHALASWLKRPEAPGPRPA